MLKCNHKYLFQLVNQRDGCRSQPFICDPVDMKLCCASMDEGERSSVYVLCLMDTTSMADEDASAALNFPLMMVTTFMLFNFNDNTKEALNG